MTVVSPIHQLTMGQVVGGTGSRLGVRCFSRALFVQICFPLDRVLHPSLVSLSKHKVQGFEWSAPLPPDLVPV